MMHEPELLNSNDQWMDYYGYVRQAVDKFDDLATRMVLQGTTFSAGILAISGVFFSEALKRAPPDRSLIGFAFAIGLASVAATLAFTYVAVVYSTLLGAAVKVAKELEDKLLGPPADPAAPLEKLKLSKAIDAKKVWGRAVAGERTFHVFNSFFVIIMAIEVVVSAVYLLLWLGIVTI